MAPEKLMELIEDEHTHQSPVFRGDRYDRLVLRLSNKVRHIQIEESIKHRPSPGPGRGGQGHQRESTRTQNSSRGRPNMRQGGSNQPPPLPPREADGGRRNAGIFESREKKKRAISAPPQVPPTKKKVSFFSAVKERLRSKSSADAAEAEAVSAQNQSPKSPDGSPPSLDLESPKPFFRADKLLNKIFHDDSNSDLGSPQRSLPPAPNPSAR
eukprot:FR739976.1.p1 GENE.FR739976.1~~FR739976.1.p1  ORF type:complete len:225 (+),score=24.40 FR739976.1:40-675(+)